jgi:hypothetical protein
LKKAIVCALVVLGTLLVAPYAQASACPGEPPSSQPFLSYGDDNLYFLAPAGSFDAGAPGWALDGGATVASAPSGVPGPSLVLPSGASATSPPICVARGYTHARMFGQAVVGPGPDRAKLQVDILYGTSEYRSLALALDADWEPTRQFSLGQGNFDLDPVTGTGQIQLRFSALGPATGVVDDVYIDPHARN